MENYIKIDDLDIFYSDTGSPGREAVILMHGWGCDHTTVASIEAALSPCLRVINVDLPGHGKSSEPPLLPSGKPWGVYEYAALIGKLIEMLGLEKPSLIGHSYGGRIAIILASSLDIDKLVLVDAAGIKPKRKPKYYLKVYSFKSMKFLLHTLFGKVRGGRMVDKWRRRAGSADYNNASEMMRKVMSRSVNQDLRKHLPEIKSPSLLIWGEEDRATPLSDGQLMEKLIPDAGLVVFPGCGHYSFLDSPARFKAVIKSFFNIS